MKLLNRHRYSRSYGTVTGSMLVVVLRESFSLSYRKQTVVFSTQLIGCLVAAKSYGNDGKSMTGNVIGKVNQNAQTSSTNECQVNASNLSSAKD